MILGGLWHVAAWTFVIWGAYHGALLALHRAFAGRGAAEPRGPVAAALARVGTFHLVVLGWVFFRAPSLPDPVHALARLQVPGWTTTRTTTEAAILVVLAAILHLAPQGERLRERFVRLPPVVQGTAYALATIA